MMTSAQAFETSVSANISPFRDHSHLNDQTTWPIFFPQARCEKGSVQPQEKISFIISGERYRYYRLRLQAHGSSLL